MKKIIKSLFCLMMFFGLVCLVTACDEINNGTEPKNDGEIELIDSIKADDSGVYQVTPSEDGKVLDVTADKNTAEGDEYASLSVDLSGKDLSKMQSLRFTISGTCIVIVKIESPTAGNAEVTLVLGSTSVAYEWDLVREEAILAADDVHVYIFAMPGKNEGVGTFSLSNVVLSEEEALFGTVITSGYTEINADVNTYDGTSTVFDINDKWAECDPNTYVFTKVDNGVKVDWTVSGWQYAQSPIAGAFGKLKYLTIKVTGTKGQSVLLKAEGAAGNIEQTIKFSGEEQVLSLDLSSKSDADVEGYKVLIFANAGNAGSGSFVIHACYFGSEDETSLGILEGDTAVYSDVNDEGINTANDFNLNGNKAYFWTDAYKTGTETLVYTVEASVKDSNEAPWKISWDKAENQNNVPVIINVSGNLGNFAKIQWGIDAEANSKLRVELLDGSGKVIASKEFLGKGFEERAAESIVFADAEINGNDIKQVRIYTDVENDEANTGEIVIHWLNIADRTNFRGTPVAEITKYNGGNGLGLNETATAWHDGGSGVYALTTAADVTPRVFSYTKAATGHEWAFLVQYVESAGLLGNFGKIGAGLNVPAGVQFLLKVEGNGWNKEVWCEGTGEYAGYEIDLSDKSVAQRNSIHSILIFVAANNTEAVSGEFEIHWMAMQDFVDQTVAPNPDLEYDGTSASFDVNKNWNSGDKGVYTVTSMNDNDASPWLVSYNKTAGQGWSFLYVGIKGELASLNKITCGISLAEGMKMIVKIEGNGAAKEASVVGDANEGPQAIEIDFSDLTAEQKNGLNKVIIFVDYENAEATTGSYEIHWFGINQ